MCILNDSAHILKANCHNFRIINLNLALLYESQLPTMVKVFCIEIKV